MMAGDVQEFGFRCGARTRSCRKCGHRYPKEEYDLWECPECGEHRACQQPVAQEGKRCRFHGGATPIGPALPYFKHGRYSKYLPTGLATRYEEARNDKELLALRDDIALVDARLTGCLSKIGTGVADNAAEAAYTLWQQHVEALRAGDRDRAAALFNSLGEVLEHGRQEAVIWQDVAGLLEHRRRLINSERKRLLDMQQMISTERALVLMGAIVGIIREHVTDKSVLNAVSRDIRGLLSNGDSGRAA